MIDELMFADGLNSGEELEHYGIPRKSGRYPWGSGENPYHHGAASPGGRNGGEKFHLTDKQKKAIKTGAIAAGVALAAVGTVYLAKSGALNGAISTGKRAAANALSQIKNNKIENKQYKQELKELRKERLNNLKYKGRLTNEDISNQINRLKNERELKQLTIDSLYPGRRDAQEALSSAGKRILTGTAAGAGLAGAEYLIRKYLNDEMTKEEFAKATKAYMRPKK